MATYNIQVEDSAGNKYHPKPDLLTTKEQLRANTAAGKSVDALVVKELDNNLTSQLPGGVKILAEGSGADVKYYAQLGADAASKKLLGSINFNVFQSEMNKALTANADYDYLLVVCSSPGVNDVKVNNVSIHDKCFIMRTAHATTSNFHVRFCRIDIKHGDKISLASSANYQTIFALK